MKRYPHWLAKLSGARQPDSVICVDCTSTRSRPEGRDTAEIEALDSWQAVCLRRGADGYRPVQQMAGQSAVSFWGTLDAYLQHPGTVWILSWRCTRVWSLLALWEALEIGHVRLAGIDSRSKLSVADAVQSVRRNSADPLGPVSAGAVSRLLAKSDGYVVIEDPPSIVEVQTIRAKGKAKWIDSRNFGVEIPAEVPSGMDAARWLGDWITGLADYMVRYKLGSLCATAASQAMTAWRTSYYAGGVYCATEPAAIDRESDGFCGGRCEAYRIGAGELLCWHLDRRSAYAFHCATDRVPVRLTRSVPNRRGDRIPEGFDCSYSIATVAIDTTEADYPLRRDGLVIFPVGRYITTLCGPELQDAMQRGRVRHVIGYNTYDMAPALSDYARAVYAARCEADAANRPDISIVMKRMLVCLPGKLGQRIRRWQSAPDVASATDWGEWVGADALNNPCRYRSIAGHVQRDVDEGWGVDSVPAIAAWITSAARMALLSAIRCAGREHVYYCDTDSLMVDEIGLSRMKDGGYMQPDTLGAWSIRGGPAALEVLGIKHYDFGGSLTCSGLPRGVQQSIGDGVHYWYSLPPTSQIKSRHRPDAYSTLRAYNRRSPYRHGIVAADGSVSPIVLDEW